jgi:uncharacterized protein YggE
MRVLCNFVPYALVAALAFPVATLAEAPVAQISVTGEGRVDAVPDMATVSLGVTTQGATAAEALAANSAAVQAMLDRLTAAGIAARDIQTTGLSLNPLWSNYDSSPVQKIEGYAASNMVTVRVRALDGLGGVLDAAVTDGANTLSGLSFGLADPEPALREARAKAVQDARARAEVLAGAAGVKLGRVLSITEGGLAGPSPMPMYRAEAAMAPVPVAGGEVAMSVTATLVWEIAQ